MHDPSLANRVVLLTGASGGIGTALGQRLLEAGAHVACAYGRHADDAERLVAAGRAAGRQVVALAGDLAEPGVPARLVADASEALGPVDVLVANAGFARAQDYPDVDLATWDTTMAVNLRAPFLLAQAVLPGMEERGFGRVLLVSSIAGFTGGRIGAHYAASKAGLHGLVHYLAPRVAARGVTVNALAPALIERTRMMPAAPADAAIPVGRAGQPEEVADLALAMLANGYLTNQVFALDGGMHPR